MRIVFIFGLLAFGTACSTESNVSSVRETSDQPADAILVCEQDDGDQWIDVEIALNDGPGLVATVRRHNDDNGTQETLATLRVAESFDATEERSIYRDSNDTFVLDVSSEGSQKTADLSLLVDGPGSLSVSHMMCYAGSL